MKFSTLFFAVAAAAAALCCCCCQALPIEQVALVVEVAHDGSSTSTTMTSSGMPAMTTPAAMVDGCVLECTKLEYDPICSSNGRCLHEFPNKCVMDVFTCRHPQLEFLAVDPMRCRHPMMPRCSDQDLKGGH